MVNHKIEVKNKIKRKNKIKENLKVQKEKAKKCSGIEKILKLYKKCRNGANYKY